MSIQPPRDHVEMVQLAERYVRGEVTADDYFAAVDAYAKHAIEEELREMAARQKPKPDRRRDAGFRCDCRSVWCWLDELTECRHAWICNRHDAVITR